MRVFGLTGGIGMGKSTAAHWLCQRGVPVVDTDVVAREIVEPGQSALCEIQKAFGHGMVGDDGRLRREELARIVFSNPAARRKLEDITHPRIRELWLKQVETWRAERQPLVVVVIPLLFETGAEKDVNATVCLACSTVTQRQRLLERGWNRRQIEQRVAAQWPVEKKIAGADFVIWTEGSLEVLAGQLTRVFRAECAP
jgi:dephospho-CoA kinase